MAINPIVVLGGGIAGLSCACRLQARGLPVLLLEKSQRPGGVIHSVRRDGFLFDLGPQSFLSTEPLLQFISEIGLEKELLKADPRAPRFVLLNNSLTRVPLAPPELLTTPALSFATKIRLFTEPFRKAAPPEPDESIAAFVRRKFTQELLENLASPFVSGVYAGDAERISLRAAFPSAYEWEKNFGSVLRGAMKSRPPKDRPKATLCSFRSGLGAFPEMLAQKLGPALRTNTRVLSVQHLPGDSEAPFCLTIENGGRQEQLSAAALVIAAPAYTAAALLESVAPRAAESLRGIEYAPVGVVSGGYRSAQIANPLEGFGYLIPRKAGRATLGTVWNSSLFPGRAPVEHATITSFIGGATNPEILGQTENDLGRIVEEETHAILGVQGAPVIRNVSRYVHALPQYNLGHTQRITSLREAAAQIPGLFLAGNYLDGPSISATVESALKRASEVEARLRG